MKKGNVTVKDVREDDVDDDGDVYPMPSISTSSTKPNSITHSSSSSSSSMPPPISQPPIVNKKATADTKVAANKKPVPTTQQNREKKTELFNRLSDKQFVENNNGEWVASQAILPWGCLGTDASIAAVDTKELQSCKWTKDPSMILLYTLLQSGTTLHRLKQVFPSIVPIQQQWQLGPDRTKQRSIDLTKLHAIYPKIPILELIDMHLLVDCFRKEVITWWSANTGGFALFPKFGSLKHSCAPNCILLFDTKEAFLFALQPIQKGEVLTIAIHIATRNYPYYLRQLRLIPHLKGYCDISFTSDIKLVDQKVNTEYWQQWAKVQKAIHDTEIKHTEQLKQTKTQSANPKKQKQHALLVEQLLSKQSNELAPLHQRKELLIVLLESVRGCECDKCEGDRKQIQTSPDLQKEEFDLSCEIRNYEERSGEDFSEQVLTGFANISTHARVKKFLLFQNLLPYHAIWGMKGIAEVVKQTVSSFCKKWVQLIEQTKSWLLSVAPEQRYLLWFLWNFTNLEGQFDATAKAPKSNANTALPMKDVLLVTDEKLWKGGVETNTLLLSNVALHLEPSSGFWRWALLKAKNAGQGNTANVQDEEEEEDEDDEAWRNGFRDVIDGSDDTDDDDEGENENNNEDDREAQDMADWNSDQLEDAVANNINQTMKKVSLSDSPNKKRAKMDKSEEDKAPVPSSSSSSSSSQSVAPINKVDSPDKIPDQGKRVMMAIILDESQMTKLAQQAETKQIETSIFYITDDKRRSFSTVGNPFYKGNMKNHLVQYHLVHRKWSDMGLVNQQKQSK